MRMKASAGFASAGALGIACGWVMALAWLIYLLWLWISFREPLHDEEVNIGQQKTNSVMAAVLNPYVLIVGRPFVGFGVGVAFVATPVYTAKAEESSPTF
ncbi:unnamed protein product [Fraxinus pennsylvanica]|uniref:Uncharacterized protein n=1 Tax=Fraxinus pennsylvanica TaxID=56036 RepID=A0AAD1ZWQ5_9LAMI|nr:unnamed protein product [Fraxinus pennsylvanica]